MKKKKKLSNSKRKKLINQIVKEGDRYENRNKRIEGRRKNTATTKAFRTPQSFGPASDCIIIKSKDDPPIE
jgi:hypothetical protein